MNKLMWITWIAAIALGCDKKPAETPMTPGQSGSAVSTVPGARSATEPPAGSGDAGSAPGAAEGKMCGGIAGIGCAEGMTCKMTGSPHPDQAGTCVRAGAAEGKTCGGFGGIRCAEGMTCKMTGSPHPDQAGTCVRP